MIRTYINNLSSKSVTIRREAANFLLNLAKENIENRKAIHREKGIISLVQKLSDDAAVCQAVIKIISCLIQYSSGDNFYDVAREEIVNIGGVRSLVNLLVDNTVKQEVTEILYSLFTEENCAVITESVGIVPFVRLLEDANKKVRHNSAGILGYIVSNSKDRNAIVEAGAIPGLIEILVEDSSSWAIDHAVKTLKTIALESEENKTLIINNNAVIPLLQLMNSHHTSDKVCNLSAALLCALANKQKTNQTVIADMGIVPLLQIADKHCSSENREQASKVLYSLLINHRENKAALVATDGIRILTKLVRCGTYGKFAAKIFTVLANNYPQNKQAIIEAGAVEHLIPMITGDYPSVEATQTLQQLAKDHPAGKMAIVQAGGIPALVGVLSAMYCKDAKPAAINTLLYLAEGDTVYQDMIVDANVVPALLKLSSSWEIEDKKIVQEAISFFQPILEKPKGAQPKPKPASIILPVYPPKSPVLPIERKGKVNAAQLSPAFADLNVSSSLPLIHSQDIECGHQLGRGGFGEVYEAFWQGTRVAVKKLLGQLTAELLAEFKSETEVHGGLRHPNIIALYGVCLESMKYAMVLEFMANGSLYDVLRGSMSLPWSTKLRLAIDAASGLQYLHSQNIIHRDLKSLNILVNEQMQAKIADFGLAKIKLTTNSTTPGVGTPLWMAPELFDEGCCNKTTDIYAISIVLWEIAARKLPYEGKNQVQMLRYVERGGRETIPADAPASYATLIAKCWTQRASERPIIEEVAQELRNIRGPQLREEGHEAAPQVNPKKISPGYKVFS